MNAFFSVLVTKVSSDTRNDAIPTDTTTAQRDASIARERSHGRCHGPLAASTSFKLGTTSDHDGRVHQRTLT